MRTPADMLDRTEKTHDRAPMRETSRFLLVFDHETRSLRGEPRMFSGDSEASEALDAYDAAEEEWADQRDRIEVLLVGAESLDAVKATHGRFFTRREEAGEGPCAEEPNPRREIP